jgi:hypothetical protein
MEQVCGKMLSKNLITDKKEVQIYGAERLPDVPSLSKRKDSVWRWGVNLGVVIQL